MNNIVTKRVCPLKATVETCVCVCREMAHSKLINTPVHSSLYTTEHIVMNMILHSVNRSSLIFSTTLEKV